MIPKSIPAKFRKHIEHWDDERDLGSCIIVTLKGLHIDGPGTGDGSKNQHVFGEDTVADVIKTLRGAMTCHCDVCNK